MYLPFQFSRGKFKTGQYNTALFINNLQGHTLRLLSHIIMLTALKNQKVVTAYFSSKPFLPFRFAERSSGHMRDLLLSYLCHESEYHFKTLETSSTTLKQYSYRLIAYQKGVLGCEISTLSSNNFKFDRYV